MNIPKLSIIVPVYNIAGYLTKCLDSLLSQTFKEIEIIVVNDASTDNSQSLIDQYCAKDNRIVSVINPRNIGNFLSRLEGLKKISGKYVTFVDGDDYLEPSAYEAMYSKAVEGKYDILACNINRVVDGALQKNYFENLIVNESVHGQKILKSLLLEKITNSLWNKLFTREIVNAVIHDDLFIEMKDNLARNSIKLVIEDQLFNFFAAYYSKSYFMLEESFYNYIFRENSLTSSKSEQISQEWLKSAMHNFYILEKLLERDGIYSEYIDEIEEMKHRLIVKRKRRVLSLFPSDIRRSTQNYEKVVQHLEQYVGRDYVLKHIIDAAQLEISQLKKDNDKLLADKRHLKQENHRKIYQLEENLDIRFLAKNLARKVKKKVLAKLQ